MSELPKVFFSSSLMLPPRRVTRLGKILSFGYFFKSPGKFFGGNMVCLRYLKSLERVWRRWFGLACWASMKIFRHFWLGNCFGYFFPKIGQIISRCSSHPSAEVKIDGHIEACISLPSHYKVVQLIHSINKVKLSRERQIRGKMR